MQARLSLKGRALQLLAQRDQSRVELRRKLLFFEALADASRDKLLEFLEKADCAADPVKPVGYASDPMGILSATPATLIDDVAGVGDRSTILSMA